MGSYLWLFVLRGAVPLDGDVLAGWIHGDCEGLLEVLHVVWHREGELHGGDQAASGHGPVTLASDSIKVRSVHHPLYVCNVQTVVSKAWTAEAARSSAKVARVVMVSRALHL